LVRRVRRRARFQRGNDHGVGRERHNNDDDVDDHQHVEFDQHVDDEHISRADNHNNDRSVGHHDNRETNDDYDDQADHNDDNDDGRARDHDNDHDSAQSGIDDHDGDDHHDVFDSDVVEFEHVEHRARTRFHDVGADRLERLADERRARNEWERWHRFGFRR